MFTFLLSTLTVVVLVALWTLDVFGPNASQNESAELQCSSLDCLTPTEVQSLIGFRPLEPSRLPVGYILYSRTVPVVTLSEETRRSLAQQGGIPLTEVPETAPPTTVHLQFRFAGRGNVPAIDVIQRMDSSSDRIKLELPDASCGEEIDLDGRRAFYGEGTGILLPSETPGVWVACPADGDLEISNLIFAKEQVLIEIKVFPEGGFARAELVDLAESMLESP